MRAYAQLRGGDVDGRPLSIVQPGSPVIAWPAGRNGTANLVAQFFRCDAPPYKSGHDHRTKEIA
jgi:hypothetical protein